MEPTLLNMLLVALFVQLATAVVLTAPTPAITAAPLVAREVTTLGYVLTTYGGTTLCMFWDTVRTFVITR